MKGELRVPTEYHHKLHQTLCLMTWLGKVSRIILNIKCILGCSNVCGLLEQDQYGLSISWIYKHRNYYQEKRG